MKIHVSELEGRALDWAVAMASVIDVRMSDGYPWQYDSEGSRLWNPTRRWSQCGPLIDEYEIDLRRVDVFLMGKWVEAKPLGKKSVNGPDRLTAACRAIVAAKLGDEVEIPDELVEQVESI